MDKESTIKVKDNKGKENTWIIEKEYYNSFQIFSNGIITYIYRKHCYMRAGQLCSNEIRNNKWSSVVDCSDCKVCYFQCFQRCDDEMEVEEQEDRSIDLGYLEPDWYGLDFIYEEKGTKCYGV